MTADMGSSAIDHRILGSEDPPDLPPHVSVETRRYHFPPATLTAPAAETCSEAQVRGVAERALCSASDLWALQGSPGHMRRVCSLLCALDKCVIEQDLELSDVRRRLAVQDLELSDARRQLAAQDLELGAYRVRFAMQTLEPETQRVRLVAQGLEFEALSKRLAAAHRMVEGARALTVNVRGTLAAEVASHRATKQQADREHEGRIAAEEELRVVGAQLALSVRRCAQLQAEALHLRHQLAGTTPALVRRALHVTSPQEEETTIVDPPVVGSCRG